jgi:hypothetical protein
MMRIPIANEPLPMLCRWAGGARSGQHRPNAVMTAVSPIVALAVSINYADNNAQWKELSLQANLQLWVV